MKKNKTVKRIIIILSVICVLAATIIAINAAEPSDEYGKEIASGKFDQYGLWTLYDSGTMVCSGTAFDSSQPLTVSPSKIDSEYSDAVIKIVFDVNCECIGSLYSSFKSFRNLETVEMPDSVDTIASSTFQGCSALADIKFSSSLKEIGSSAFRDCTSLNNIDLPASLEKIGSNAFNNTGFYNTAGNWINTYFLYCGRNLVSVSSSINISSVKISDKTKLIADSAFSGLGRIEEISIPDSVKVIPLSCFENMKALCTDSNDNPQGASRPFDKTRSGFVMGEGGGVVVLEELEHAKKRGAHIYAELAGFAMNTDAYHITAPDPAGEMPAVCMEAAIKDAGLTPDDIDYINAHGTSTHRNDLNETIAAKKIFGERAYKVPMSSNKSMTGHLLGGAGGMEAVATTLTIVNGIIPPTINYHEVDAEDGMDLDYVPNEARKQEVRAAMSSNFGFGGHNAVIVIKKFEE